MKRFFIFTLLFFSPALSVAQTQNAVVKRNTYLREGPSTSDKKITLLKSGDELQLIDPEAKENYFHVRTSDGDEGYAYSGNVTVKEAPEKIATELAAPSGKPATEIASTWEKPAPKKTTFHGQEGDCPWNGDDSDPDTFVNKNRADTAEMDGIQYHDVTWAAIAELKYPVAKPLRKNWTADQIGEITPFEGEAVRTTGYLVAFKPQSGGNGEGTNCHFSAPSDTDTHMALVTGVGDAEKSSVVIEFTPRFLKAHPNWKKSVLSPWLNSDDPVRISGWLMLDPDHRNHLNRFRSTLWEIHPITKIEVWKDNLWVDVDKMK
jgi:Bacterial SH3 domain